MNQFKVGQIVVIVRPIAHYHEWLKGKSAVVIVQTNPQGEVTVSVSTIGVEPLVLTFMEWQLQSVSSYAGKHIGTREMMEAGVKQKSCKPIQDNDFLDLWDALNDKKGV